MAVYTTIDDPTAYFKVQLYTGNGSTNVITFDDTDTNMQPDVVWLKNRNSSGHDHFLFNSVNGAERFLSPNDNGALASADSSYLTSFNSDGFTLGSSDGMNENTITFVSWNWKESAVAGMDIVSFTGNGGTQNVSHSLSAVPELIFTKRLESAQDWFVFTTATGAQKAVFLNSNSAESSQANAYDAVPTSSIINYGNDNGVNGSSETYTAFLWRSVQGFSKMGTYTGNNNADGAYVHLGFRPAWLMIKRTDASSSDWVIMDNKRLGYNPDFRINYANLANNEEAYPEIDWLANGFKLRGAGALTNDPNTYFYMAFAESPFVNSKGVPNNAR